MSITVFFLSLCTLIQALINGGVLSVYSFGVYPGNITSIFLAELAHVSWEHLVLNALGFLMLASVTGCLLLVHHSRVSSQWFRVWLSVFLLSLIFVSATEYTLVSLDKSMFVGTVGSSGIEYALIGFNYVAGLYSIRVISKNRTKLSKYGSPLVSASLMLSLICVLVFWLSIVLPENFIGTPYSKVDFVGHTIGFVFGVVYSGFVLEKPKKVKYSINEEIGGHYTGSTRCAE